MYRPLKSQQQKYQFIRPNIKTSYRLPTKHLKTVNQSIQRYANPFFTLNMSVPSDHLSIYNNYILHNQHHTHLKIFNFKRPCICYVIVLLSHHRILSDSNITSYNIQDQLALPAKSFCLLNTNVTFSLPYSLWSAVEKFRYFYYITAKHKK